MDWTNDLLPALLAFVAPAVISMIGVRIVLGYLRQRSILDRPNDRSSHTVPTPRGGGIAVIAVILAGLMALFLWTRPPAAQTALILGAAAFLALVSWLDDLRELGALPRLAAQVVAVLAGLSTIPLTNFAALIPLPLWLWTVGLALAWIWFVNLFNFMDGIDGIAGVETITIGVGLFLVGLWNTKVAATDDLAGLILAGAALGFLVWNWHPARIFLGDVGSVPLGFLLAWLLIRAAAEGTWAPALILPLYYLADSTITLVRRLARGERAWRAHKEHFYQRAVQGSMSHSQTALAILAANILLIGFAGIALARPWVGLTGGVTVVLVLLFMLNRQHRAGKP